MTKPICCFNGIPSFCSKSVVSPIIVATISAVALSILAQYAIDKLVGIVSAEFGISGGIIYLSGGLLLLLGGAVSRYFLCHKTTAAPSDQILNEEEAGYAKLKKGLDGVTKTFKPFKIQLVTDSSQEEVEVTMLLGKGGSKQAYALANQDRALIVANYSPRGILKEGVEMWEKSTVPNEIQMSAFLEKVGLFHCHPQKVTIRLDEKTEVIGYTAVSFEALLKQGTPVVDHKMGHMHAPQNYKDKMDNKVSLFKSQVDWKSLCELLFNDIAKLVFYSLPTKPDSLNLILIPPINPHPSVNYQIRYLGFDFPATVVPNEQGITTISEPNHKSVQYLLKFYLTQAFFYHYGGAGLEMSQYDEIKDLVELYSPEVLKELEKMI